MVLKLYLAQNSNYMGRNVIELGETSEGILINLVDYQTVSQAIKVGNTDDSTVKHDVGFLLAKQDGAKYTIVTDSDKLSKADLEIVLSKISPASYAAAVEDGRYNYAFEEFNYMYLDPDAVYVGRQLMQPRFLWVNENGEVFMSVWICNGMSEPWTVSTIAGQIMNGDKEIAAFNATGGITVAEQNGRLVSFSLGMIEDDLPTNPDDIKVVFD